MEQGGEQKPRVTLDRLSWDIEQLSKDVRAMGSTMETRYAELAARGTADHQLIRELMNWRAGIFGELAGHFYSQSTIDRMLASIEKELAELKAHVQGRRSGDAA